MWGCPSGQPAGTALQPVWRQAFNAADVGALSAVWGSGPGDVFVVGGTPQQGEVYHFDGLNWRVMDVPAVPLLVWVFGFGPDDVFAVGEGGGVIHYDGTSWRSLPSGTGEDLWGVWGWANNDLWIVGGTVGTGLPLILHYDGATFQQVPAPPNDRSATSLFKVWGIGSKVSAVGENGLIIELRDGAWTQVPAGAAADDDFVSLWGTSEDNIVAVGGRTSARVARYDGTSWTTTLIADVPGLNGVFMAEPGEAIVGGTNGFVGRFDLASGMLVGESSGTNQCLHAVWGNGVGSYYAVGGRFNEPYAGIALVRQIGDPDAPPEPVPAPLRSCRTVPDCATGERCENGDCVPDVECVEDVDCDSGEVCVEGACVPEPECDDDRDCAADEICAQGLCIPGGGTACANQPDCVLGEECREGFCQPADGPDLEYWAAVGGQYAPVVEGGILPIERGFQGGVHTFLSFRAVGFDPGSQFSLTIGVTRDDTAAVVGTERTVPAVFTELPLGMLEAQGIFYRLDQALPGQLLDVPGTLTVRLTDFNDPTRSATLVQRVSLAEVDG
jgi:hypothetical protein